MASLAYTEANSSFSSKVAVESIADIFLRNKFLLVSYVFYPSFSFLMEIY
jgi:hypothetical protein